MKQILISIFIFLFAINVQAQDDDEELIYPQVIRERSLNLTGLLNQFIPFGNPNTRVGPITYAETKIKGQKIRRFGLGMNVDPNDETQTYFHFRFGGGKELMISDSWSYYRGLDIWAFAGNFNLPNDSIDNSFFFSIDSGIGLAPFVGVKYHVTENVNIGTESNLFIGLNTNDGFLVRAVPPISLFISMRFVK